MTRVEHIESPDRGDFGKCSDAMSRQVRAAERTRCIAGLRQGVGIVVSEVEALEQLTRGPYLEAVEGAGEVAEALTHVVSTLSEFLLDAEGRCVAVLQDANHPGREEAVRTLQAVAGARAALQKHGGWLGESEQRQMVADRRSREPKQSK